MSQRLNAPAEPHIAPIDAFTFTLERDPLLRATIVAVATFERPPDWDLLVERIDRATRLVPRFRQKLVDIPLGLAPPRWIVDPDFDLSLHLHRVRVAGSGDGDGEGKGDGEGDGEGDGDMAEVLVMARSAGSTSFDRDRPLWQFTLVEGLPSGRGALIMKLHHALTDGVGGIEIAAHVVDLSPTADELGPMPEAPAARPHGLFEVATDTVDHHLGRLSDVGRSVADMVPRLLQQGITHPSRTVQEGVGTALAIGRFVRPVTRTSSPIMRERRNLRDLGHFDVSQHALSDAAHRQDSTLNDAFLAGIAGGLRRYHERHRAAVDHLRVSMPVNVRTERDGLGGNHVTVERFDLPVGTTDPARRMRRIAEICRALRHDPAIPYASTIASVLNLLPVDVTASMLRHVDLLASNVPGFPMPVYVGGARLEAFHVFGATLGSAANVTLMSYDGTCHVGVSTDTGAVPDPDLFLTCLQEGFAEVIAT